ncbi:MAG: GNAT family N-acetyltransferase [Bacteroidaceae bacterium]|nr:GNAT family N-acetyltransferase [Bacteroidaceae bacterium]
MLQKLLYNTISLDRARPFLRNLWHEAFGDCEAFIDTFLDLCASDEVLHTLSMNGRVVSALYALPYTINCNNTVKRVAYIYAVATDSEFRQKGLMRLLMSQVHDSLQQEGYAAAFLLPSSLSLANYYASMGYRVCACRKRVMLAGVECAGYIYEKCDTLDNAACTFISNCFAQRRNFVIHPQWSLRMNVSSCVLSGGALFLAKKDEEVVAAAFVVIEDDGTPLLLDILYCDETAKSSLVAYISKCYSVAALQALVCDKSEGAPFAMALPLDDSFPDYVGMQLMLDK